MSFLTQRYANRFPLWTKTRRDPSSLAQRLMSTFAEVTEERQIFNVRLRQELFLYKRQLGPGHLYDIVLDDDDKFPLDNVGGSSLRYTFPTITGTLGVTDYLLTRYEALADMISAAPDRLTLQATQLYTQYLVWDSSAIETYVAPPRPERLIIEVSGSSDYFRKTRITNPEKSGRHQVVLRGTDQDDNAFSESVAITDDGVFWTSSIYKTLVEVTLEGFNGAVTIKWFPSNLLYELDPYRTLVLDDNEGQLKLRLDTRTVSSVVHSYVIYETERLKLGELYRNPGTQVHENTEEHGQAILLDSSGDPYTAVDLAINPSNSKLYVLDDTGLIHIYDHAPTPFSPPALTEQTVDSYIELHPLQHYAPFGISEKVFTYFARLRFPIARARIKRVTPGGVTEYLQSDRVTWAAGSYFHVGQEGTLVQDTWTDFHFNVLYDELGQWDFYINVQTTRDDTTYCTSVMVDSMSAESSVDSNVIAPTDLGFSQEGWLAVGTVSTITYFSENIDGWLADTTRDHVLLHSNYDSVDVTY